MLHELEFPSHIFGELPDVQVAVHEEDADHGGGEEVGEVVGEHGELVQLLLIFRVDGIKLFVHGLQLFVGALQLLVCGQQLFVCGLQLLVDGFQFADGGFQVVLGFVQLLLQVGDASGRRGVHVIFFRDAGQIFRRGASVFKEEDGDQPGILLFLSGDGAYGQVHHFAPGRAVHRDPRIGDGNVLRPAAVQRGGGHQAQVAVDHAEEVEGGLPRSDGKVVHVVPEEMDHVVGLVEHHGGGQEVLQEMDVGSLQRVFPAFPVMQAHGPRRDGADVGDVEGRRGEFVHLAFSLVDIDLFRAADRAEDAGKFPCGLAFSQEQIAAALQGGMEDGEQGSLQHRLEIDHHIPAGDQVQLSEGRVGEHVVGRKNDHAPDLLGDGILLVFLGEKFGQPFR